MTSTALDHEAISRLFVNHRAAIVNFLMHRVQCLDTAQDLSQETYLRLMRLEALPHADNLTGYLFRTAERLAIDFMRQRQRSLLRLAPLDEAIECAALQPDELAILRQQCELLLDAIARLPKLCRHVFLLRKIDELSYSEIAAQLGVSEKTVQRHLVKAMLHCHSLMQHDYW